MTAGRTPEAIRVAADRIAAAGDSEPRAARDPVNLPMIRNWLEALGTPGDGAQQGAGPDCQDTAPPAMIQVWTMPGLHGARADDDPLAAMMTLLDEAGYQSVVATNCDQVYLRPVKLGERLAVSARLLDVSGPKRTALGEGWFVTTRSTWTAAGEPVATMDFRVLKYCAASGGATPRPPLRTGGCSPPRPPLAQPPLGSSARWSRRTPRSSGTAPRPGNCASSAATGAGRCATRPARCARPAVP